ncbi:Rhodanese-like protein, partial [Pluteus cervinus]
LKDSYLIDVREPEEVIQGMIPSAVNLPLSVLATALHLEPNTFKEKYGFNKPEHPQEVIFYCRSGVRSTTASDVAKRNGYTNILNYKGSWLEWVEKENKKSS